MGSLVAIRGQEWFEFSEPGGEVFFVVPPATDRGFENGFGDFRIAWRTHLARPRMLVKTQNLFPPLDAEEIQGAARLDLEVLDDTLVAHLDPGVLKPREHAPPEAHHRSI